MEQHTHVVFPNTLVQRDLNLEPGLQSFGDAATCSFCAWEVEHGVRSPFSTQFSLPDGIPTWAPGLVTTASEGDLKVVDDPLYQQGLADGRLAFYKALADPVRVHALMLRGDIATPDIRQFAHLIGQEAVVLLNLTEACRRSAESNV